MRFTDIIAQEGVKQRLADYARRGRVPHALMLCGREGCGALPLAVAFGQLLLGNSAMAEKLQHPDLHFAFPIYKKKAGKAWLCDDFLPEWRGLLLDNPYFGYAEWLRASGAENQQLAIYVEESDAVARKLALKSSQGGYKVCVVWLPEKMNEACANKLLKLLEEPPLQTVFLLVSERPDLVLPTIRSRTQTVEVPLLAQHDIEQALAGRCGVLPAEAKRIAHSAEGSMTAALRAITDRPEDGLYFELFVSLMRLSYMRKVKDMKQWSEQVAALGRERQKQLLAYAQHMVRENFVYNFHCDELNYMSEQEAGFAVNFAPFINERNVAGIMGELALAQRDIGQNGNAKIVFFDLALKMTVLIKNR